MCPSSSMFFHYLLATDILFPTCLDFKMSPMFTSKPHKREVWRQTFNVLKWTQGVFFSESTGIGNSYKGTTVHLNRTLCVNWFNLGSARDALFVLHKELQALAPVRKHFCFLLEDKFKLLFNQCLISNIKLYPALLKIKVRKHFSICKKMKSSSS